MNILVCIKQVPDLAEIKVNPVTNTLIREGVPSIINPYDMYALEAAARIKEKYPDTRICALTMGPPQASAALREAMAVCADQAYLVSGRPFGGADTLATSYTLACAIHAVEKREGHFDMVFCGKQSIDSDTAQVGPELAEHLDYPQVTSALEVSVEDGEAQVWKEADNSKQLIAVDMPCVITFTKPPFEPRYPNIRRLLAANRTELPVLTPADLDIDPSRIGVAGSATQVKCSFLPPQKSGGVVIREVTEKASALKLASLLADAGAI